MNMPNKVYVNEIWTYGTSQMGAMFIVTRVENEQVTMRSLNKPEDSLVVMSIYYLLKCMKYVQ